MHWADVVRRVREQNGMKQEAFAYLLGVDQATVSRWECGKQAPGLTVRNKLMQMLTQFNLHQNVALHGGPQAGSVESIADSLLAMVYAKTPVGLCFVDADLRFVLVNERLAAINGLPVEAHVGRRLSEVLGDLGWQLEPLYQQVLDSGEPLIDMEVGGSVPGDIGPPRYWSVSYHPVFGSGLRPIGLSVAVIEITERKNAELALRAAQEAVNGSEARFRAVLNMSPIGFLLIKPLRDDGGRIVDFEYSFANTAALNLIGGSIEELRLQTMLTRFPAHAGAGGLFERYVRVRETGQPHEIEFIYRADGVVGWFQNSAVRIDNEVAISFQDVTERRRALGCSLPDTPNGVTIIYDAAG